MSGPRPILRLGTRGSLLARTQSQLVADALAVFLQAHFPEGRVELVTLSTAGDRQAERPLADSGGKGLFVKEIEEALLAGAVDLAVHSAKDMPTESPPGLLIAATPRRELPNDVWIGHNGFAIDQLPSGAAVGTASLRRRAQLLARRPDLVTVTLRGNIDTRLRKIAHAELAPAPDGRQLPLQGTFLAAAGLRRTQLLPPHAAILPTDEFIPAAGQGVLAIQCRDTDTFVRSLLVALHDPTTASALAFERAIVAALAGSCLAPIGVCAEPRLGTGSRGEGWIVRAIVAAPDGTDAARATLLTTDATDVGLQLMVPPLLDALEQRGARTILARLEGK